MTSPTPSIERLRELLAKARRGPWEIETEPNEDGEYGAGPNPSKGYDDFMILGAEGGKILGTENATHKLIEEDYADEDGYRSAWDASGKANAALIVEAVNALPSLLTSLDEAVQARDQYADLYAKRCGQLAQAQTERDEAVKRAEVLAEKVAWWEETDRIHAGSRASSEARATAAEERVRALEEALREIEAESQTHVSGNILRMRDIARAALEVKP